MQIRSRKARKNRRDRALVHVQGCPTTLGSRRFLLASKSRLMVSTVRPEYRRRLSVSEGWREPVEARRSISDCHATCAFLRSSCCVGLSTGIVLLGRAGRVRGGSGRTGEWSSADTGLRGEDTVGKYPSLGEDDAMAAPVRVEDSQSEVESAAGKPIEGWDGRMAREEGRSNLWCVLDNINVDISKPRSLDCSTPARRSRERQRLENYQLSRARRG